MHLHGRILIFLPVGIANFITICDIYQRSSLVSWAPLPFSMKQSPCEKHKNQYDVQNCHRKVNTLCLQSLRVNQISKLLNHATSSSRTICLSWYHTDYHRTKQHIDRSKTSAIITTINPYTNYKLNPFYIKSYLTLREPILTEQEPFLSGWGAELEQTGDDEQSPQEQPSEVSPHE